MIYKIEKEQRKICITVATNAEPGVNLVKNTTGNYSTRGDYHI